MLPKRWQTTDWFIRLDCVQLISLPFSYEIMKRCWKVEPKERPTFIEIHQLLYDMLINNEVSKR